MGRFIAPRPKRKTRHRLSLNAVGILGNPRNPGLTTYQPGFGAAPAASLEVGRVGLARRSPAMRELSAIDLIVASASTSESLSLVPYYKLFGGELQAEEWNGSRKGMGRAPWVTHPDEQIRIGRSW